MKEYPIHPVANFFPMMDDAELAELAKDIKENGQIQPILIATTDGETVIVDGRNRIAACELANVEPFYQEVDESEKDHLTDLILSLNIKRRNITASQKAAIAIQALPFKRAEAKMRQKTLSNKETSVPQNFVEPVKGEAMQQAAKSTGANKEYVRQAEKIQQASPEKFAEVAAGKKTIHKAMQEIKEESKLVTVFPAEPGAEVVAEEPEEGESEEADTRPSFFELTESFMELGKVKKQYNEKFEMHKKLLQSCSDEVMAEFNVWKKSQQPF